MTTAPTNPKVEHIRQRLRTSYDELSQLIDGPLSALETHKLYATPSESEWSIMQNLAHTVEFMPYWANEIEKLVATPGQNFGRIATDEGRLQGIERHSRDTLQQIKATLPESYARLEAVLSKLQDSDLELSGHHVKFGERSLDWLIEEFITVHLPDHVAQVKACLAALE